MVQSNAAGVIGQYEYIQYQDPSAAFRPYDSRCTEVAQRVAELIRGHMPDAQVEHIGSTAIPGCDGKGVVDLMLLYPPGRLVEARNAVDSLGFQRQRVRPNSFPEERPVRVGAIKHDGAIFRLHVHVISGDASEAREQLVFRDRLRADPALVSEYVARKRAILAAGVANSTEYNDAKDPFIKGVLTGSVATSHNERATSRQK